MEKEMRLKNSVVKMEEPIDAAKETLL